jgi:hypothetical protein
MESYLAAVVEAESWYDVLQLQLGDLEEAERLLSEADADALRSSAMPTAGPSGTQASTPISTSRYAVDVPDMDDSEVEGDVEMASGDESSDGGDGVPRGIDTADASSVDRMLERSVKPGTLKKYSRHWDKWALFALAYDIEIMPPDMRGLEIYIADLAELSGSMNVANLAAASIAHFSACEGFSSPFTTPRLAKLMRGIRLSYGKAAKPKKPFTLAHIIGFMEQARNGSVADWRAAFPLVLCFQQLLRGAECFNLNGGNVIRLPDRFHVVVETAKNHPDGFTFEIPIDRSRPTCVGRFMEEYMAKMGIRVGDKNAFFACKLVKVRGSLTSAPGSRVGDSTMRASCKTLIAAAGLNPKEFASHSSRRGGALAASMAGATGPQIQDLGRWHSAAMVARYTVGDVAFRSELIDLFRP